MGPLERHLEQLLANFPHLVNSSLWKRRFPVVSEFGEVNVCVRQGALPECCGRVDLAFVTDNLLHVVELKRRKISMESFYQLKRYIDPLQKRYPHHLVLGYLVGRSCRDLAILRQELSNERVSVLLVGQEIPRIRELRTCGECGAGFHFKHETCPYCAAD